MTMFRKKSCTGKRWLPAWTRTTPLSGGDWLRRWSFFLRKSHQPRHPRTLFKSILRRIAKSFEFPGRSLSRTSISAPRSEAQLRKGMLVACRSEFVTADAASGVGVFPLDRPSIGGVGVDVASEFASQVGNRGEDAARDDLAFILANQISTWLSQDDSVGVK